VELPTAQLSVERTFSLDGSKVLMETEVRPLDGIEKSIEWCEHVTIGGTSVGFNRCAPASPNAVTKPSLAHVNFSPPFTCCARRPVSGRRYGKGGRRRGVAL
jgi:hypothetical protein